MPDKSLYIFAGYDEMTDAHLTSIQNKLFACGFTGKQTRNIPQHITMGSLPSTAENEQKLAALLHALSENTAAFEVTFNHVGIFGGMRVLFLAPDVNADLLNLKEQIESSYNWTPHSTTLIDDPEIIYKALPIVMNNFSAFSGRVTTLHLYEFFPTRHILSVALKA